MDFGGRSIRISQSLWQGQLVSPKTKGSIRTIAFGEVLEQVLTEHLERSTHIGAKDFLFCTPDGETYNPDMLEADKFFLRVFSEFRREDWDHAAAFE